VYVSLDGLFSCEYYYIVIITKNKATIVAINIIIVILGEWYEAA